MGGSTSIHASFRINHLKMSAITKLAVLLSVAYVCCGAPCVNKNCESSGQSSGQGVAVVQAKVSSSNSCDSSKCGIPGHEGACGCGDGSSSDQINEEVTVQATEVTNAISGNSAEGMRAQQIENKATDDLNKAENQQKSADNQIENAKKLQVEAKQLAASAQQKEEEAENKLESAESEKDAAQSQITDAQKRKDEAEKVRNTEKTASEGSKQFAEVSAIVETQRYDGNGNADDNDGGDSSGESSGSCSKGGNESCASADAPASASAEASASASAEVSANACAPS